MAAQFKGGRYPVATGGERLVSNTESSLRECSSYCLDRCPLSMYCVVICLLSMYCMVICLLSRYCVDICPHSNYCGDRFCSLLGVNQRTIEVPYTDLLTFPESMLQTCFLTILCHSDNVFCFHSRRVDGRVVQ